MNIYVVNIELIPDDDNTLYFDTVINNCICYTLEEAVDHIKYICNNKYYNEYEKYPTDIELSEFIKNKNIIYDIKVHVVSGERKRFNTSKELMEYFNENISKISNENLFNFLLSLCDYYIIEYDYLGNIISEEPILQCPIEEGCYYERVQFTRDSCSRGEYIFEVR